MDVKNKANVGYAFINVSEQSKARAILDRMLSGCLSLSTHYLLDSLMIAGASII